MCRSSRQPVAPAVTASGKPRAGRGVHPAPDASPNAHRQARSPLRGLAGGEPAPVIQGAPQTPLGKADIYSDVAGTTGGSLSFPQIFLSKYLQQSVALLLYLHSKEMLTLCSDAAAAVPANTPASRPHRKEGERPLPRLKCAPEATHTLPRPSR